MPEKDIVFEIKEHLGVLAKYPTGWTKELNLISWNGQTPKFDVRDWDPDHERMSRGVTLHPREIAKMVDLYLSKKNKQVIEEAQAAEEERWKRINAEKRQNENSESNLQSKVGSRDEKHTELIDTANAESLDVDPVDALPIEDERNFDASSLVEEPAAANEGTPF